MTATDSDRILAAGAPIKLAGGEARIRFGFRALKTLEDHYGNLPAAIDALNAAHSGALNALESPVLDAMSVFVSAGLVDCQLSPEDVLEQLDTTDGLRTAMLAATTACVRAWVEAFPPPRAEGNGETEPTTSTDGSPGQTSTGSSPGSPGDPTTSSGA